jgi:hypothetical protein
MLAEAPAAVEPRKVIDELLGQRIARIHTQKSHEPLWIHVPGFHHLLREQIAPATLRALERKQYRYVDSLPVHAVN